MRWDQYSNVIQLAAALSLAGWVARTPDNPQLVADNFNNFIPDTRYNPYGTYGPHYNEGSQEFGEPMVMQQQYQSYPQNSHNLYQSKDAEDGFRSLIELQELISWQEAYRRGDLQLGSGAEYNVLPIVNNDKIGQSSLLPDPRQRSTSSNVFDDGYASGETSIGSPSSSVQSNNFDDLSTIHSPIASGFDLNDLEEDLDLPGAVGYTLESNSANSEFDIDELLENNFLDLEKENSVANINDDSFHALKTPFSNIKGLDEDLEYVNSPLKSPSFDEFLASPNPGSYNPYNPALDNSFEDPFQMRFTNSSIPDNKFISDTLLELGDFDPSVFENTLADEDIDNALVESLSSKNEKYQSGFPPKETVKNQIPFDNLRHVLDHDYQKQYKQEQQLDSISQRAADALTGLIRANQRHIGAVPRPAHSRTYAPLGNIRPVQTKIKQQKRKDGFVWPDFPYTSDELVDMTVETFNEIIERLSEIKKHVARDIRRKGKNKEAARNCRKRKMDVIDNLDIGVGTLEQQRIRLLEERQKLIEETQQIRKGTEWLNSYIFEHLRDANGSPYSSSEYSLQYTSDGNVYLVPSGSRAGKRNIPNTKV